ncbi:MAG: type II toxin-antitoxin system HicB family antitoxin [Microgenomates group bacterium]|nr:type II toxin-antitoxin system HicB family antitoxin [Microgenomates group bacterium]
MKKIKNVYNQLSALVWKEDKFFVAKCLEVEVASQGKTKKEALKNLKEALELYFEDFSSPIKSSYSNISLEKISINNQTSYA